MVSLSFSSAERALDAILRAAARDGVSDIHIEPEAASVRVRLRKDGRLYEYGRFPAPMAEKLAVRAKVMGRMNVAETRIPQDGGAAFSDEALSYDLRISTLPSLYGETIVIRMLSGEMDFIEKRDLGMLAVQEAAFLRALTRQSGLLLTTGPTGSGKTSTLYAALMAVNVPSVNVISIEDPIEYKIPGVTQTAINEKAGLTFAAGLRSIVRQDPDILMIGEIRDRETAEIAVHAALTGHLVLSSLHTRRAAEAPLRLMDMGIPAYLLASALSLIISQRLVPALCQDCRKGNPEAEWHAPGCPRCQGSGRAGRTGVFEMLAVDGAVEAAIHDRKSPSVLAGFFTRQHQPTMAEAAREMAKMGRIAEEDARLVAEDMGG